MFFGTEVKNNQNRATSMTMDCDVKLSQAVLDPASKGNKKEPVCLMAEIQGKSFILAVLDPAQSWQSPLDLILGGGTEVKFYLRGQGTVHLTGYEFRDDFGGDDFDLSMSSDDDDMDDENENSPDEADSKHAAKKVKTKGSPTPNGARPSKSKRSSDRCTTGTAVLMQEVSDEDDSDDEDLSFSSVSDEDDEDISDSSDMDDLDLNEVSSDDGGDDDDDQDIDEDEDDESE